MIFFDADGRTYEMDGFDALALITPCCEARITAEAPLSGIWALHQKSVRPDGPLAICTGCREYVTDPDGTYWLASDKPNATIADVREALRYDDMENSR